MTSHMGFSAVSLKHEPQHLYTVTRKATIARNQTVMVQRI
jgi:hypothetical protein